MDSIIQFNIYVFFLLTLDGEVKIALTQDSARVSCWPFFFYFYFPFVFIQNVIMTAKS